MPSNAVRWIKGTVWAAIAGGLATAAVVAFLPKPVPVETQIILEGAMTVTVDEDGITRVVDRYILSAPLSGMFPRLELSPGDAVTVGMKLATIEAIAPPLMDSRNQGQARARLSGAQAALRQSTASVERSRAAHRFAKNELERVGPLAKAGNIPRRTLESTELTFHARTQDLESAKFGARVARYEVEIAKAALGRIDSGTHGIGEQVVILSPIDGEVLRILNKDERVVTAGTPLVELADPNHLEVVVDVLTSDAVNIQYGDQVEIDGWGGDRTIEGAVVLVEPSAFTRISALGVEEQRVNVVIKIIDDDMDKSGLGDGFRVEAHIATWSSEQVVKVPISALFREGRRWAVFCVVEDHAELRPIDIGERQGLEAQVLAGLKPGETVVVHPHDAVLDGVSVVLDN